MVKNEGQRDEKQRSVSPQGGADFVHDRSSCRRAAHSSMGRNLFLRRKLLLRRGTGRPCCGTRGHQDTTAFLGYFHPNLQNGAEGIERLLRQLIGVKVVNGF